MVYTLAEFEGKKGRSGRKRNVLLGTGIGLGLGSYLGSKNADIDFIKKHIIKKV